MLKNINGQPVQGKINVKYLNEFIDENLDVQFTREYLVEQSLINVLEDEERPGQESDILLELIAYIAQNRDHDKNDKTLARGNLPAVDSMNAENEADILSPAEELEMTGEEIDTIDIIVPGLKDYIYDLFDRNEELDEPAATELEPTQPAVTEPENEVTESPSLGTDVGNINVVKQESETQDTINEAMYGEP